MRMFFHGILVFVTASVLAAGAEGARSPSFADFDSKAKAGERLNVVFFGASLTWGANASDPLLTSYRANVSKRLEQRYPDAHFRFWDAAIGGTGSQLGVFRFERDVMRHKPDLIFLDFSANDDICSADPETLASYESLVRRVVTEARVPLVMVIFPFRWNVEGQELAIMKRRDAHMAIAKAYGVPVGDAIALAKERVEKKEVTADELWPIDGVHPCDRGYVLFADAAWAAYEQGVEQKITCTVPEKMLYAETYRTNARVKISSLAPLPEGWRVGMANPLAAFFDFTMSRWLDDESIACNRKVVLEDGKKKSVPQDVARLKVKFQGEMVMLFGETTPKSGKYRVHLDGKVVEYTPYGKKESQDFYDAGDFARRINGNGHYNVVLAKGLDAKVPHTLEIEPLFDATQEQELRLESICVAGGAAKVERGE